MRLPIFLFAFCCLTSVQAQTGTVLTWPIATPEEVGMSSGELNGLFDYVRLHHTPVHSVQVVRHGKLVLDAYFFPFNSQSRHDVASVTKSITSSLVGIAIDKKYIPDVTANALQYFPDYKSEDKLKQKITLEDLITMRSGFDCGTDLSDPRINVDQRLIEIRRCQDWVKCILDLPMASEPGSRFAYCNGNCHLLSKIVSMRTGKTLSQFAKDQLFSPLGIKDFYWPADPTGVNYGWSDLQLHPYDMLKIGELMLHHGKWNNRQLISEKWLQTATKEHVTQTGGKDHYGYFWWVPGGDHPDVFEAVGRGGQRITVWPSNDMVIVFTGGGFDTSELISFIVSSVKSDRPIAPHEQETKQLKENLNSMAKPPLPAVLKELPELASHISGKTFKLSTNGLNLKSFQLIFDESSEATMNLIWEGQPVRCTLGLDGRPRFSDNSIIRLAQACTGDWIAGDTFLMKLDLVGGINAYNIKIRFTGDERAADITVNEGTGLNNETFGGERMD